MRARSAAQQAVLDAGHQSEHLRVSVKDSGGTFRDLTTYPGFNAVRSADWSERIDEPHMTCDVLLRREADRLSLAPLVTASALNHDFNPAAAYGALLALNREVKVEVAIVPLDRAPGSGDWMEVFRGRVDELDAASGADIKLGCRSLGGRLAQQFIKTELVYSFAAHAGHAVPLRVWAPQMPVTTAADGSAGLTYCLPATRAPAGTGPADPGYNRFYKCTTAGTTGTNEPTWTTGTGITDGSAVWAYVGAPSSAGNPVEEVMQNLLNDHKASGDPTVILYTPVSPSWAIRQYLQQREFVLDALSKLAKQIGWDLRFKWRAGTSQFELTFAAPARSSPSVDFTFAASDYGDPTRLAVNIANIRNAWRVVYSDRADLFPGGAPKRKQLEVSDATSITRYGELWAEIQEDEASNIDSVTEATALINAALSDCKEPTAELSVPLSRGFPWVELNDYLTFSADGRRFDTAQSLAVTGWTQRFDEKGLKTSLELRGLPTIGAAAHLARTVHPYLTGRNAPPTVSAFDGTETPHAVVGQVVGGLFTRSNVTQDKGRAPDSELEQHVYRGSGSTLSDATLKGISKGSAPLNTMSDLVPGVTYYGRSVPRSYSRGRLVRGEPSAEWSAVAGRASSGHLDSKLFAVGPPNGAFVDALDDLTSFPPDHWTASPGSAWGSSKVLYYGSTAAFGRHLALQSIADSGSLTSGLWPIPPKSTAGRLRAIVRPQGTLEATRNLTITITFYSDENAATSVGSVTCTVPFDIASPATWVHYAGAVAIPVDANFARCSIQKQVVTSTYGFDVARVEFIPDPILTGLTGSVGIGTDSPEAWLDLRRAPGSADTEVASQAWSFDANWGLRLDTLWSTALGIVYDFKIRGGSPTLDRALRFLPGGMTDLTQQTWQAAAYGADFSDYGSGFLGCGYMKDSQGFVHLRGTANGGAAPTTEVMTLPAGYRPSGSLLFVVWAAGVVTYITINSAGVVTFGGGGSAASLTLDGITFDTR